MGFSLRLCKLDFSECVISGMGLLLRFPRKILYHTLAIKMILTFEIQPKWRILCPHRASSHPGSSWCHCSRRPGCRAWCLWWRRRPPRPPRSRSAWPPSPAPHTGLSSGGEAGSRPSCWEGNCTLWNRGKFIDWVFILSSGGNDKALWNKVCFKIS